MKVNKIIKMNGTSVIGVLSGKGGVGKTTLVANLGAALASEFSKKVLLIDSNVKTSHLGLHLGLYEELPVTLREVLLKKVPVMYAIFLHPSTGLRLLPAPIKGNMDLKKMDGIVKELKTAYNPILVDCAPGLGKDVVIAAKAIDKAILITTPDLPAVTDTLKTIELMKRFKKDIIGIVLNRVENQKYELTVEEIESTCGYDVISIIPESNKIPESIAEGMPVVMNSGCPAATEFKRLAASLVGEEYQPAGLWYKLKQLLGISTVSTRKMSIPRKHKAVFVREGDVGKEEQKLIKEKAFEEVYAAAEKLGEDVEKEVMEKVKEKLRKRLA